MCGNPTSVADMCPFMEYIRKHKTKIHVSDLAALTRAIAARDA